MRWLRAASVAVAVVVLLAPATGRAQDRVVKIGVLDDMSGPYSDNTGPGDLLAVRMAVADFGGSVLGKPIEVISADMQNKVDVGVGIARRRYEQEQVDMIIGIPHSAIALGVVKLAEQTNRLVPTAAATAELTGKSCSAHSVHWVYDTYGQGETIANAIVKQGGDTWFFITVDYAFGHALNDFMTRNGRIREDGRVIRDMYLMQVKTPDESKGEWDLAKIVATIPGEQASRPLAEGGCPLVKK
jgi:branched-chain amino acid transport system substrate-binding protein